MGTRAKVILETNKKKICSRFINMDGHVENWAPSLINALRQTTPEAIVKNKQLFDFMLNDTDWQDITDYSCKVDVSSNEYRITVYGFNNEKVIFEGTLDEFSAKYDEL